MACACSSNQNRMIYACSGAANTGYLADQVARRLALQGAARMSCLSALGAELEGFIRSAQAADLNLVVDGCPTGCGRKIFARLGLSSTSVVLTELGVEKGKTLIDEKLIGEITDRVSQTLSPV